ncbi:MAG: zinc-ribbon domain-containing protein [Bacteroidia bacterium]|nr:zinc-ribbon domain-containing protein [Bacteroidia bacterium]
MDNKCFKCGNPVQGSDKFCPHCGNIINNQPAASVCQVCNHQNPVGSSFCEKCGASLMAAPAEKQASEQKNQKKIVSKGSYSGKMIKSKTSKGIKIFRNIIIGIVLSGIIALIFWFQTDPEAGKKLTDVLTGIGFMIVFFFFGWLFMRGKKGRKSDGDDDQFADVDNDNNYDSDDDD